MGLMGKTTGIYTQEELEIKNNIDNLYSAMGILLKLEIEFSQVEYRHPGDFKNIGWEENREYYTFAELFDKQYNSVVGIPVHSKQIFATAKIEELQEFINKIKQLSNADYYAMHPTYLRLLGYVEYLHQLSNNMDSKQTNKSNYITSIDDIILEKGKDIKDKLPTLIKGCKGKRLALIVYVLYTEEYIRIPDKPNGGLKALFEILKKHYGATGTATGLRDCLRIADVIGGRCPFTRKEDIQNIEEIQKVFK